MFGQQQFLAYENIEIKSIVVPTREMEKSDQKSCVASLAMKWFTFFSFSFLSSDNLFSFTELPTLAIAMKEPKWLIG